MGILQKPIAFVVAILRGSRSKPRPRITPATGAPSSLRFDTSRTDLDRGRAACV